MDLELLPGQVGRRIADRRRASGGGLVEHEPEAVEVGARVGRLPAHALGGDVHGLGHARFAVEGARPLGDAREPEVAQTRFTFGIDDDVARAQTTEQRPLVVGVPEGGGDVDADLGNASGRLWPLVEHLGEGWVVDELGHDVGDAVVVA